MAIALRKPQEIEKLRAANKIVGGALELLRQNTKVGVSLKELDAMGEDYILSCGAKPSFKGLYGFPNAVCCSLNQVIIHGIPTDYRLQEGDVIGYDVGTELDGCFGDAAVSVGVGNVTAEDEALIACAKDTLYDAISFIKVGMRFKELSLMCWKSLFGLVVLFLFIIFVVMELVRSLMKSLKYQTILRVKAQKLVLKLKTEWFFVWNL